MTRTGKTPELRKTKNLNTQTKPFNAMNTRCEHQRVIKESIQKREKGTKETENRAKPTQGNIQTQKKQP